MSYMGVLQGSGGSGAALTGDQLTIANNAAGTQFSRPFNTDGCTVIRGANLTPAALYLFGMESAGGFGQGNPMAILPPQSFFEQPIYTPSMQILLVFDPLHSGQPPGTAFTLNNAAQVWIEAIKEDSFPAHGVGASTATA